MQPLFFIDADRLHNQFIPLQQKLNINRKRHGTIRFFIFKRRFKQAKKVHRNAGNNTTTDHENYARGYEDGYDDCCCDHDSSYDDYHDSGYCDRDEYEDIENDECYDDNCGW